MRIIERLLRVNFSERSRDAKVSYVILHATAKGTLNSIIEWFENPDSKVSSHYLVGKNEEVVVFVPENKKAWHAGVSEWNGLIGMNDYSIGIELLNDGEGDYPKEQIRATAELVADIMKRRKDITIENVIGHADVSPGRKVDPGPKFPWDSFRDMVRSMV